MKCIQSQSFACCTTCSAWIWLRSRGVVISFLFRQKKLDQRVVHWGRTIHVRGLALRNTKVLLKWSEKNFFLIQLMRKTHSFWRLRGKIVFGSRGGWRTTLWTAATAAGVFAVNAAAAQVCAADAHSNTFRGGLHQRRTGWLGHEAVLLKGVALVATMQDKVFRHSSSDAIYSSLYVAIKSWFVIQ